MKQQPKRFSFTHSSIQAIPAPEKGRDIVWDIRKPKLCLRITEKGAKTFYYVTKVQGKTEWNKLGRYPDLSPEAARTAADLHAGEFAKA